MAQWNGVKEYDAAGTSVVTGCTSLPLPMKTYCALHKGEPTPVAEPPSRVRGEWREEGASALAEEGWLGNFIVATSGLH